MSDSTDLSQRVKTYFDNRDFDGLMQVINVALKQSDGRLDAGAHLRGIQQSVDDEKLREEFEIHIENLKNEAMKQFDQERYGECLGTFRFLCELEPDNRIVRDYLELCQQLTPEAEGAALCVESGKTEVEAQVHTLSSTQVEQPVGESFPAHNLVDPDRNVEQPGQPSLSSETGYGSDGTQRRRRDISSEDEPGPVPHVSEEAVRKRVPYRIALAALFLVLIVSSAYYFKRSSQIRPEPVPAEPTKKTATESANPVSPQGDVSARDSWLQKAELAARSGNYVSPVSDNAVAYCNRILNLTPGDSEALRLRQDGIDQVLAQAKRSIENQRFGAARDIYSSLLQLSQQETDFPVGSQDLKAELDKLTFVSYPVVHDHILGNCRGDLRFNAYALSFVPLGNSTDDFLEPFSQVRLFAPGDKLKIEVRVKTYHFASGLDGKQENRERVRKIFHDLTRRAASGQERALEARNSVN
jgi:hypothetical protein